MMLLSHRIQDQLKKEPCYISTLATRLDEPYKRIQEEIDFLYSGGFIARSDNSPYAYRARTGGQQWHWTKDGGAICACDQAGPCFSNYWIYNGRREIAEILFEDHIKANGGGKP